VLVDLVSVIELQRGFTTPEFARVVSKSKDFQPLADISFSFIYGEDIKRH